MTPFVLTYEAAIAACRKAHAEGRLGYQIGAVHCLYVYPNEPGQPANCGCAIGVALPDDMRAGIDRETRQGKRVTVLSEHLPGFSVEEGQMAALDKLQRAHDAIVTEIYYLNKMSLTSDIRGTVEKRRDEFIAKFEALIGVGPIAAGGHASEV